MVVINNDENVILLNKSAERMIGIKMEDALGKRISTIIPNGMLPRVVGDKTRLKRIKRVPIKQWVKSHYGLEFRWLTKAMS